MLLAIFRKAVERSTAGIRVVFVILSLGGVLVASCDGSTGQGAISATVDEPFLLRPGQAAEVKTSAGDLRVHFISVTEDSRCPADAVCITSGRVSTLVSVSNDGRSAGDYTLTVGETGSGLEDSVDLADGTLALSLLAVEPQPTSSQTIESDAYRATFVVTNSP